MVKTKDAFVCILENLSIQKKEKTYSNYCFMLRKTKTSNKTTNLNFH